VVLACKDLATLIGTVGNAGLCSIVHYSNRNRGSDFSHLSETFLPNPGFSNLRILILIVNVLRAGIILCYLTITDPFSNWSRVSEPIEELKSGSANPKKTVSDPRY
jgi:hypothetical protein